MRFSQLIRQVFVRRKAVPLSPLVVLDVLAALGADLSLVPIFLPGGAPFAEWHPTTNQLHILGGMCENLETDQFAYR